MAQFPNPVEFVVAASSVPISDKRYRVPFGVTILRLKTVVARSVGLGGPDTIDLKFVDEEGDFCILSSEGDLQEAIRLSVRAGKPVRLIVSASEKASKPEKNSNPEPDDPTTTPTPTPSESSGRYEMRTDSKGREFFVDHVNKTTSWQPPAGFVRSVKPNQVSPDIKPVTDVETKLGENKFEQASGTMKNDQPESSVKTQENDDNKSEVTLEAIAALLDERLAPRSQKLNLEIKIPGPEGSGSTLSVPYTLDIAQAVEEQEKSGSVHVDVSQVVSAAPRPGDRTIVVDIPLQDAVTQQAQNGHVQVHLDNLISDIKQQYQNPQYVRDDQTLCESEWSALPASDRSRYDRIAAVGAQPVPALESCAHTLDTRQPGIVCDACEAPLRGIRYHCTGKDYDLCAAAFSRLPPLEHLQYECITEPGAHPESIGLQSALSTSQRDADSEVENISTDELCSARLAIRRQEEEFQPKSTDSEAPSLIPMNLGALENSAVNVEHQHGNLEEGASPVNLKSDSSTLGMSWDTSAIKAHTESEVDNIEQYQDASNPRAVSETCSEASEFFVLEALQGQDGDFVMVPATESRDSIESPIQGDQNLISGGAAIQPLVTSTVTTSTSPSSTVTSTVATSTSDNIREKVIQIVASRGFTDQIAIEAAYEEVDRKFMENSDLIREAAEIHRDKLIPVSEAIADVRVRRVIECLDMQPNQDIVDNTSQSSHQFGTSTTDSWVGVDIESNDKDSDGQMLSVEEADASQASGEFQQLPVDKGDASQASEGDQQLPVDEVDALQASEENKSDNLIESTTEFSFNSTTVAEPTATAPNLLTRSLSKCDQLVYEQLVQIGFGDPGMIITQITTAGELPADKKAEARRISTSQNEPIECAEARIKLNMLLDALM